MSRGYHRCGVGSYDGSPGQHVAALKSLAGGRISDAVVDLTCCRSSQDQSTRLRKTAIHWSSLPLVPSRSPKLDTIMALPMRLVELLGTHSRCRTETLSLYICRSVTTHQFSKKIEKRLMRSSCALQLNKIPLPKRSHVQGGQPNQTFAWCRLCELVRELPQ